MADRLRPRVELLSELDLLAGADRSTLERLAAAAEEVVLPAGSVVIREGDEPDALWILARGELSVRARDGGEPRELPPVTAPGYVGELGPAARHPAHRHGAHPHGMHAAADRRPGVPVRAAGQPAERPLLSVAGTRMARTPGRARRLCLIVAPR